MTKLVIALDNLSFDEARERVLEIEEHNKDYKDNIIFKFNDLIALVGFEGLFSIFQNSKAFFMLDAKYHDIGNTMKNYFKKLANSRIASKVAILTVHASVGEKALKELLSFRDELGMQHIKIFAITALTSLDDEDTQAIYGKDTKETVLSLARIAYKGGVDGVVCSVHEVEMIKQNFGDDFLTLTPGVRLEKDEKGDQKRVASVKEAREKGSDFIVMGRPILRAQNPSDVIRRVFNDLNKG